MWNRWKDLWSVLSWWSKSIKLFLYLSLFLGELFWVIFFLFRTIHLLYFHFLQMCFGITQMITSLKNLSTLPPPLMEAILRYLRLILKYCIDVFGISLTVNLLRKISQHLSLFFGQYAVFLGIFWLYSSRPWKI